jgi:hypothetical protein
MNSESPIPSPPITIEKKRDVWDRIKLGAEILGIGVLITYTVFSALLWSANKINELNARLERRPYVGIVGDIPSQTLTAERTFSTKAHNYGISPARGVYAYGVFKETSENWRFHTCGGQNKTMDFENPGPTIFQGSDENIDISVEPGPPKPYLAVCLTFMDMQGPFHWFDDPNQGPPCSPYSIKHLYRVMVKDDRLAFHLISTSVEGAAPQLSPKQRCYGEQ